MKALGAYLRIDDKRYLAGFALVEDGQVVETQSLPAPPDESLQGQLAELYDRTSDLIDRRSPELFALKVYEKRPPDLLAHRAEGVVLAAAGQHRDLTVGVLRRPTLCVRAGLPGKCSTKEAVATLLATVTPAPNEDEVRQATAAAVAMLVSEGPPGG